METDTLDWSAIQVQNFPDLKTSLMARLPALTTDMPGKLDKILSCPGKSTKILSYLGIWLQILKMLYQMLYTTQYLWIFMFLMISSDFMADE